MPSREEIRGEIVDWFLMRDPSKDRSWAEWEVKVLFNKLDSQGVVIKVNAPQITSESAKMCYYEELIDDKVQRIREVNLR